MQFHDARALGIALFELFQSEIQREDVKIRLHGDRDGIANRLMRGAGSALFGEPPSRMLDEYAPHRFSRSAEEMGTAAPLDSILVDEPQIRFVYERGAV